MVAMAGKDGDTRVIHLHQRDIAGWLTLIARHQSIEQVTAIDFDPEGHRLAIGGFDRTVRILSLFERDEQLQAKLLHGFTTGGYVTSVRYSPDGAYLAYATGIEEQGAVRIVKVPTFPRTGEWQTIVEVQVGGGSPAITFSPDGEHVALSGTTTFIVSLQDWKDGTRIPESAVSASFSPDGNRLVLGGGFRRDNLVRVFSLLEKDDQNQPRLIGWYRAYRPVRSVSFAPDGDTIAVALENPKIGAVGKVLLLSASTTRPYGNYPLLGERGELTTERAVKDVSFSYQGDLLAVGGEDAIVWVFGENTNNKSPGME
jgi:WD40 repeat protein